jgi:hypothetical protein
VQNVKPVPEGFILDVLKPNFYFNIIVSRLWCPDKTLKDPHLNVFKKLSGIGD